jgi:hypothetical protein
MAERAFAQVPFRLFRDFFDTSKTCSRRIEDSPRQATGNLHRKEHNSFYIRSLTPPQAAGNALP